ncbi:hypothetical protein [Methylobacterium durans]|uniref:Uncharacterized protein n=1 Tax=Methylobacterium durans TaxID=2202825 RepID=A0A2U8WE37_9HYPH|nr:hypothetical protein [Methylobacterium durans]AWN43788.1 hypothetical protein DK389_28815 [Methylobacterium durans]
MILDRVDYKDYRRDHALITARKAEYAGIRRNSDGMACFAFRAPGKARATLVEVSFIQRIDISGRQFVPPQYRNWSQRVAEIEAFIEGDKTATSIAKPQIREKSPSEQKRPWWRRLFG